MRSANHLGCKYFRQTNKYMVRPIVIGLTGNWLQISPKNDLQADKLRQMYECTMRFVRAKKYSEKLFLILR